MNWCRNWKPAGVSKMHGFILARGGACRWQVEESHWSASLSTTPTTGITLYGLWRAGVSALDPPNIDAAGLSSVYYDASHWLHTFPSLKNPVPLLSTSLPGTAAWGSQARMNARNVKEMKAAVFRCLSANMQCVSVWPEGTVIITHDQMKSRTNVFDRTHRPVVFNPTSSAR